MSLLGQDVIGVKTPETAVQTTPRMAHPAPCSTCADYLSRRYYSLRGACASVGIEHGRSTDDMLADHMAGFHAKHTP